VRPATAEGLPDDQAKASRNPGPVSPQGR
jgi:hypothetical protein